MRPILFVLIHHIVFRVYINTHDFLDIIVTTLGQ